jgi:hypothetical protein
MQAICPPTDGCARAPESTYFQPAEAKSYQAAYNVNQPQPTYTVDQPRPAYAINLPAFAVKSAVPREYYQKRAVVATCPTACGLPATILEVLLCLVFSSSSFHLMTFDWQREMVLLSKLVHTQVQDECDDDELPPVFETTGKVIGMSDLCTTRIRSFSPPPLSH